MGRQHNKKGKKKKAAAAAAANSKKQENQKSSWTDRLVWVPVNNNNNNVKRDEDDAIADDDNDNSKNNEAIRRSNNDKEQNEEDTASSSSSSLSLISWNVLADAYCSKRSHPHLPACFQRHVFDPQKRQARIRKVLQQFIHDMAPDVICLQEVDDRVARSSNRTISCSTTRQLPLVRRQ